MDIYLVAVSVTWAILGIESVFALALLFSGLSYRLLQRRAKAETVNKTTFFLNRLKAIQHLSSHRDIKVRLKSLTKKSQGARDGVSNIVHTLLTKNSGKTEVEAIIQAHIDAVERGALRLCAFLAKTAPLAGLAGTLIGVQNSLSAFSKQADSPQLVISGFATALLTTLSGVFTAILCVTVSRLIWEPGLQKTISYLTEFNLTAQSYILEIKQKLESERRKRSR